MRLRLPWGFSWSMTARRGASLHKPCLARVLSLRFALLVQRTGIKWELKWHGKDGEQRLFVYMKGPSKHERSVKGDIERQASTIIE